MLTLIATALLGHTMTLTPSDDIWVYPHAADPAGDNYLRIWGSNGGSVPTDSGEAGDFSMGFLKWSLAGVPTNEKLVSAQLVVTNIGMPGFTKEQSKFAPLEAHQMPSTFGEKGWTYDNLASVLPKPGLSTTYGSGSVDTVEGKTVTIKIDLTKGLASFGKDLDAALKTPDKSIAIALASSIDAATLGRAGIYKIYSKEDPDKDNWPKLVLTFE